MKPETDTPSASHEKAAARWFGSARSPTTCWTESIASVKPVPTSAAATSSGATSAVAYGKAAGSSMPPSINRTPVRVGRHGPTASSQRPARTAISIGTSANSAIITPTVKVDALFASAYSEPVMRADTNAMCTRTAIAMMRTSVM